MSEIERIKQAMADGEHTDGDLEWCVDRIAELKAALKNIAMQKLCDEMTDEETVDQGDIEYGYDEIIKVARKALQQGDKQEEVK